MEKEYKLNIFAKLFYGVLTGGLAAFLIIFSIVSPPNEDIVYLIVGLPVIICSIIFLNLFKSKVIVTETSITRQRIFYDKTLHFDEIKGVRIESTIIFIEPISTFHSKIKISNYDDLAKSEELVKCLREKFVDLDKADREKEKEALLNNNALGYNPEEREAKINKMSQIALAYNIWGFVMCFILVFVKNNSLSFWTGALYPLLGIAIMRFSSGLIKFVSASQRSLHMGIAIGLSMSVINVFIVALAGYEILLSAHAWPIVAAFSAVLFVLLYITGFNNIKGVAKGQVIGMLVTSFIYGFSNVIVINCLFDKSPSAKFKTTVVDEYTSTGKGARYHLKLNPWNDYRKIREVDVSKTDYEKAPIGSSILIYEKKGLLNIPWFEFKVDPNPPAVAE